MRRKIAGRVSTVSFTVIIPTVVAMMWPAVPHLLGYTIIAAFSVVGVGTLAIALWPERPITRDKPLGEALAYTCFREWGRSFIDAAGTHGSGVNEQLDKWRQLARDGRVAVWGKESHHGVYEPLPPEYWTSHDVDWFSLLKGSDCSEALVPAASRLGHRALMVSRVQFEKEWSATKRALSLSGQMRVD